MREAINQETEQEDLDIPTWMRQAQRGTDWGIFIALAFSLLAALPFFFNPGLPRTNDSEHYVYLTHDYAMSLRAGHLYPRWSAHVLTGYGAPIPNFYPPGAPYAAAIIEVLFTNDPVNAVRLLYILAICLAGTITYAFVSRLSGAQAGILSSLLYLFSPYLILTAPHILGDLPGVICMGLLPTALWTTNRLILDRSKMDILFTSIIYSALILTDPRYFAIVVLLTVPLITYYRRYTKTHTRVFSVLISMFISIFLAGFFWIPALLEQGYVEWVASAPFERSSSELMLPNLIAPLRQLDPGEMVHHPQYTIGLTSTLAVFVSVPTLLYLRRQRGISAIFLVTSVGLILVTVVYASESSWLLGPIALCLAVGGSVLVKLRSLFDNNGEQAFPVFLYLMVLIIAFPAWLAPRWEQEFESIIPESYVNYELNGYGIANLPSSWDIPITIPDDLETDRFLLNSYRENTIINRISSDQISAQREANILEHTSHSDRYRICVTQPTTFDVTRAYFPGWQATISDDLATFIEDSRTVSVYCPRVDASGINQAVASRDAQTGLLQVTIPGQAKGVLTIHLGTTDIRHGAWIVSWTALTVLIGITLYRVRQPGFRHFDDFELLSQSQAWMTAVMLVGFIIVALLFTTPTSPYTLYQPPLHSLRNTFAIQQRTDVGLELLTYRVNQEEFHPGEVLELELTWRTSRPLRENYQVQVHLQNVTRSIRWLETDFQYPGGYPTSRWDTSSFVRDFYTIEIPDSLPVGDYTIAIEIFACHPQCTDDRRIFFFNEERAVMGQTLLLPTPIEVHP